MNIKDAIKDPSCMIIDVRTPAEFSGGSVADAINIPLNELPVKLDFFKNHKGPVILCCASGMRSGQGAGFLQGNGIPDVFNGGPWVDVNYLKNN